MFLWRPLRRRARRRACEPEAIGPNIKAPVSLRAKVGTMVRCNAGGMPHGCYLAAPPFGQRTKGSLQGHEEARPIAAIASLGDELRTMTLD